MRACLSRQGDRSGPKHFERFEFLKRGDEMWRRQNVSQGDIRKYRADLGKVEAILKEMAGQLGQPSADQKIRELFLESYEKSTEEEANGEKETGKNLPANEKRMDERVEPNLEAIPKQHLSVSPKKKAVDQLMAELNANMKGRDTDWEKIQRVMGDLLGLEKTGELLDGLKAEVKNPEVKWEAVRKLISRLWSVKK